MASIDESINARSKARSPQLFLGFLAFGNIQQYAVGANDLSIWTKQRPLENLQPLLLAVHVDAILLCDDVFARLDDDLVVVRPVVENHDFIPCVRIFGGVAGQFGGGHFLGGFAHIFLRSGPFQVAKQAIDEDVTSIQVLLENTDRQLIQQQIGKQWRNLRSLLRWVNFHHGSPAGVHGVHDLFTRPLAAYAACRFNIGIFGPPLEAGDRALFRKKSRASLKIAANASIKYYAGIHRVKMNDRATSPDRRHGRLPVGGRFSKTLNGHFDGEHIVLDDDRRLKPNIRVRITVLKKALTKTQIIAVSRAAQYPFSKKLSNNG